MLKSTCHAVGPRFYQCVPPQNILHSPPVTKLILVALNGQGRQRILYVKSCQVCAQSKTPKELPTGTLQPLPIQQRPWSRLSIDFVTDPPPSNGFTTILLIIDRFTKYCCLVPLKGLPTAMETAQSLFHHFTSIWPIWPSVFCLFACLSITWIIPFVLVAWSDWCLCLDLLPACSLLPFGLTLCMLTDWTATLVLTLCLSSRTCLLQMLLIKSHILILTRPQRPRYT